MRWMYRPSSHENPILIPTSIKLSIEYRRDERGEICHTLTKVFMMTLVVPSRTFRDNCKDKAISRKAAIELTSSTTRLTVAIYTGRNSGGSKEYKR